jgi:carboxyl-terminal processing protease
MALTGAFALGFVAFRDGPPPPVVEPQKVTFHHGPLYGYGPVSIPVTPAKPPLALEQVRLALAQAYYQHVSASWLVEPTIEKIIARLGDPYTEYLDPAEYEQMQDRLAGGYFGVGLRVDHRRRGLVVTAALAGPARAAGVLPGDVIMSIDGKPASGLPFDRSTALLKGARGTVVRLTIRRPGEARPIKLEIERGPVAVPAVSSRVRERGGHRVGHIRLLSFSEDAAERVADAIDRLVSGGAEAIVLDLRGDPGGYVQQAIRVASLFLDHGVVCSTSGVNQESRVFAVSGAAMETKRPLAVLVDGSTASAAEIVTGALRDNKRAVVVGRRTYGKSTVQSLVALSDGGALKPTTATYLTPSGQNIGGRGVKPKVKATDDPWTAEDEALAVAERVLLDDLAQ